MANRPPFYIDATPAPQGVLPTSPLRADAKAASPRHAFGLRVTLLVALGALVVLAMSIALFSRFQLSNRIHDYAILNMAGQLRELAAGMDLASRQVVATGPDRLNAGELQRYHERLRAQAAQYDRIVQSFVSRNLPADLTGLDAPVTCTWDALSLEQLRLTATQWAAVRGQLAGALADDADVSAALAAAQVLTREGGALVESTRALSGSFKEMMQSKLDFVLTAQWFALGVTGAVGLLVAVWIRRRVTTPLVLAEQQALRLMHGDLGLQLEVQGSREIAAVATALNRLSQRLQVVFDLSRHTASRLTLSEVLNAVRENVRRVVPVDLIVIAARGPASPTDWQIVRTAGDRSPLMSEQANFTSSDATTAATVIASIGRDAGYGGCHTESLGTGAYGEAILAFLSRSDSAFDGDARSLISSVASTLRSQFDRTVAAEALVVAAVEGLAKLAESRDPETGDHLLRMSTYAAMIASELTRAGPYAGQLDARYIEDIRRFAPMHDIGKVGIADSILRKPGKLTDEERAEMSRHPTIGADVLRRCEAQVARHGRSLFRIGIEIAEGHHERWDGTGYPKGTAGAAIPLAARIVAVADVFDALTSKRPYKDAWPVDQALQTIEAESGCHFDPDVVAALLRALPVILPFYERYKHV